jgi:hypothetical protein
MLRLIRFTSSAGLKEYGQYGFSGLSRSNVRQSSGSVMIKWFNLIVGLINLMALAFMWEKLELIEKILK